MRDDLVYGKSFWELDDGWNALRKDMQTDDHTYKSFYDRPTELEKNEYVIFVTRTSPAKSRRLFRNPLVFIKRPQLLAYCVVEGKPSDEDRKRPQPGSLQSENTFLTHMSRRYSNMFCNVSNFITAGRVLYNLSTALQSVYPDFHNMMARYAGQEFTEDIQDEETFVSQADKYVRLYLSVIFLGDMCLTHIAIMNAGFMSRAVAMTRGQEKVLTEDELVIQLVKLYAAEMDFYREMGKEIVGGILIIGWVVKNAIFNVIFKGMMSMWTAHLWIALTPPMTRLVREIKRHPKAKNSDLVLGLENDVYWTTIPIGKAYDDLINCGKTSEINHGLETVVDGDQKPATIHGHLESSSPDAAMSSPDPAMSSPDGTMSEGR